VLNYDYKSEMHKQAECFNTQRHKIKILISKHHYKRLPYARFYELGLTRELTNPRVGLITSLFLG